MEEKALKVLQILEENGYEAYIVGGYVRDKLLSIESNDIDICTSATPKQIKEIFKSSQSPNYGSINIIYKNTNFDITTFRRDIKYLDNLYFYNYFFCNQKVCYYSTDYPE